MPLIVLVLIAVTASVIAFALASRYPRVVSAEAPASAATDALVEEAKRHRGLRALLKSRLDPATVTGLALTLALLVAIIGGLLVGLLAYLMRTNGSLVEIDNSLGQWEFDHKSPLSTDGLRAVSDLAGTYTAIFTIALVSVIEYRRIPSRWIPAFLITTVLGEVVLVNAIKGVLDRVRPTFDPAAASLGPSFPSGHSATAAALWAAVALVVLRRRPPAARALVVAVAVGLAVAVATSRVMLGVHWLSDAIAGLAFGWAWFAVCAIAFGGRLLKFGAPVESATDAVERQTTPRRSAAHT
jgi:membrane-associated phospholipid phosphatase